MGTYILKIKFLNSSYHLFITVMICYVYLIDLQYCNELYYFMKSISLHSSLCL